MALVEEGAELTPADMLTLLLCVGVLVDPATMASLPQAELAAGWAEVIKTALIAGGPLWERVLSWSRGPS